MPRVKLFNEEEVLLKAMKLFWRKGFHATSMQDLVDHLGINRASLYDTFGGKSSLFNRAFKTYIDINRKSTANFLNQFESVPEGFQKLLETSVEAIQEDHENKGCLFVNTITEMVPGDPEMQKVLRTTKQQFEVLFADYIRKGIEKGQISKDKDVENIAAFLFTLYSGLNVTVKLSPMDEQALNQVSAGLAILH